MTNEELDRIVKLKEQITAMRFILGRIKDKSFRVSFEYINFGIHTSLGEEVNKCPELREFLFGLIPEAETLLTAAIKKKENEFAKLKIS